MSENVTLVSQDRLVKKSRREQFIHLITRWESILFLILIVEIVVNSLISPYFLDYFNLMNSTFIFMEKAILALPLIFVIMCGDIDISVASTLALSSLFMGMVAQAGADTATVVVVGLGVGLLAGAFNGFLITKFDIPAVAVSIGTMSLYRGIAHAVLGDMAYTEYPESFAYFGQGYVGDTVIPFQLVWFLLMAVVFGIVLHKTPFGRKLYAIGNNRTAAQFSGIKVQKIRFIVFSLAGLMAGMAAVMLTSRIGSTRPVIANGWELESITMVVLGGVAITGGKGKIGGVITSIFLLGFLRYGMGLVNVPGKVMNIFTGFLLITAILLPELMEKARKAKELRRQKKETEKKLEMQTS